METHTLITVKEDSTKKSAVNGLIKAMIALVWLLAVGLLTACGANGLLGAVAATPPTATFDTEHTSDGASDEARVLGDDWTGTICNPTDADADCDIDGVVNGMDNCPLSFNPDQSNGDAALDGLGDVCDRDRDGDGLVEVYNVAELRAISGSPALLAGSYELVDNLNIGGANWQPIGTATHPFDGTFEGNGHSIDELSIVDDETNLGLFGYIGESGIVRNLRVSGSIEATSTSGITYIGGLAGSNLGTIHSSVAAVDISVSGSANVAAGGLVGDLVGLTDSSLAGVLINSYSTGSVSGGAGLDRVGGAIGNKGLFTTTRNVYATGNVFGGANDDKIAGLAGVHSGSFIEYSFTTGTVDGGEGFDRASSIAFLSGSGNFVVQSYHINTPEAEEWSVFLDEERTLEQLRADLPSANLYSDWSLRVWDFGDEEQIPALRYSIDIGACSLNDTYNLLDPPACGSLLPGQR